MLSKSSDSRMLEDTETATIPAVLEDAYSMRRVRNLKPTLFQGVWGISSWNYIIVSFYSTKTGSFSDPFGLSCSIKNLTLKSYRNTVVVCRHKKILMDSVANITLDLIDYFFTSNFVDAFYEFSLKCLLLFHFKENWN